MLYAVGTHEIAPMTCDQAVSRVHIKATREHWPDGPCLSLILEGSPDSGETWVALGGLTADGGTARNRDGSESFESRYTLINDFAAGTVFRGSAQVAQEIDSDIAIGFD